MNSESLTSLLVWKLVLTAIAIAAIVAGLEFSSERSLRKLSDEALTLNLWLGVLLSALVLGAAIVFAVIDIRAGITQGWSTPVKVFHLHLGRIFGRMGAQPPVMHLVCHLTDFALYGTIPVWFWLKCRSILKQRKAEREFEELVKKLAEANKRGKQRA